MYKVNFKKIWLIAYIVMFPLTILSQSFENKADTPNDTTVVLDEVTISESRKLTKLTDCGILYDIHNDKAVRGSSFLEALRRVPLVSIDGNDNITINGTSKYAIFLNGHPYRIAQTSPREVLKGLPLISVSKVEVITSPGNRYDLNGASVVLNIITEKNLFDGWTALINGSADTRPKAAGGLTFLARKKKVDFSLGYNYTFDGQRNQPIDFESNYKNEFKTTMHGTGDGDWHSHIVRAMCEYAIDSLNSVYVDAHGLFKGTDMETLWEQRRYSKENDIRDLFRNNNNNWTGTIETNALYKRMYKNNPHDELFSLGYRYTYTPDVRRYYQNTSESKDFTAYDHETKTTGGMNEHSLRAQLSLYNKNSNSLVVGVTQIVRSSITKWFLDTSGKDMNLTEYDQNVSAVFTDFSILLRSFRVQGGLRMEYGHFTMDTDINDERYTRARVTVLPNLSVSKSLKDNHRLQLAYNSGVARPSIVMLNPFKANYSSFTGIKGNTHLSDESSHNIQLSYMLSGRKSFLSAGFGYSLRSHALSRYTFFDEIDQKQYASFRNLDHIQGITANFFYSYRPFSVLSLMATGNIMRQKANDNGVSVSQCMTSYNMTIMADGFLKNGWIVGGQYGLYKNMPEIWSLTENYSMYSFYVSKSFLQKRLSVRVVVNSPFNRYEPLVQSYGRGEYSSWQSNYMTARSFSLRVSYTLSKGKGTNLKRNKSLRNNDLNTGVE